MMEKIFIGVLNMSLTASCCAGIVMCIRLCIRRLPKVYSYVLWLAVFVRFAVPFSLESVYSLVQVSSRPIPTDIGLAQTPQIATGLGQIDDIANRLLSMVFPQADAAASVNPLQIVITVAAWIWLLAAAGLLGYGVVSYWMLKDRIKDASYIEASVYASERIPTAFVMGIWKPRIYLPQGISDQEREYVVSHEQVHLKRYDYLVKPFAFIVVCVHWFNPMAWISLWLMSQDMELSCDEEVLRTSGADSEARIVYKKDYAAALLTMAGGRRIRISGPMFLGSGNVKKRIQNVLAFQQRGKIVTGVSVILIVLVTVGLMGSRKPRPSESDYIAVTVWRYHAVTNAIESYGDIVGRDNQAFQELEALLEKQYYKVVFHSLFAGKDYLNGADTSIVIKGENGGGFCVRSNGSMAVCKADGRMYEYHLGDGERLFHEIEDLLLGSEIVYHTATALSESGD